jgi:hypothetical protein
MIRLGNVPATALLGAGSASAGLVQDGGPYEAFVTGTVPTDKETYQDGTLDIYSANGTLVYSHTPRYRGRGNSTWEAPKKPYKVRSLNRDQTPFGFPASRDWALMADYYDQSYLRSTISYQIARVATGRWAPLSRPVRLTWNGTYQGLYRYSETADVQAGRVDIRTMEDTDIAGNELTGPYLLETAPLDDLGFTSSNLTPVLYDTPDVAGVPEQEAYIAGWVEEIEAALLTGTEADILEYIDLDSWVDWYWTAEGVKNMDSDWQRSIKWYKDQDPPNGTGKMVLQPPWDYDLAVGLTWSGGSLGSISPNDWITRNGPLADESPWPSWMYYAWTKSSTFRDAAVDAWETRFRPTILGIEGFIDARHEEIAPLIAEDRALWRSGEPAPEHHTVDWIKDWLSTRAAWIDANL